MSESDPIAATASAVAAILVARRRSGEQGPRLPECCRPSGLDAALAIQAAVSAQLGAGVAGWKCGLPAAGNWVLAPIYAGTVHTIGAGVRCALQARAGQARVEPELAFILGRDLPVRDRPYSPAEVDAAIARTHLALELIDSRYSDPHDASFAENLADGLLNSGLFIGPQADAGQARAASAMAITITIASGEQTRLDGRHPSGDPRAPLYWLTEFLRSKGLGLQAGQAVITGSYAGTFDLPLGQDIAIQYGELGTLTVHFVRR
ncbi:MAG: fumarylacetoacetate hydrolase family protein [Oxalobacteraceae bacterium]|nr:fumarylacetoacetate hydrolase family protein [Oxalobacteraceae bacterium]